MLFLVIVFACLINFGVVIAPVKSCHLILLSKIKQKQMKLRKQERRKEYVLDHYVEDKVKYRTLQSKMEATLSERKNYKTKEAFLLLDEEKQKQLQLKSANKRGQLKNQLIAAQKRVSALELTEAKNSCFTARRQNLSNGFSQVLRRKQMSYRIPNHRPSSRRLLKA